MKFENHTEAIQPFEEAHIDGIIINRV